jgi:hypothetical protein
MKLIDKKELAVAMKGVAKAMNMTTERVQTVAVQAIAYSILNKDASVATDLFNVVNQSKSLRKDSLVKYMETMGHLAFDTKEKKFGFLLNAKIGCKPGTLTAEHEATILAMRWDHAKAEPKIVSEWDMEAQFRAFIGRMQKIVIDPAVAEGKVKIANHDILTALSREFNRVNAEKVLKSMVVDKDVIEAGEKIDAALAAKAAPATVEPGLAVVNG